MGMGKIEDQVKGEGKEEYDMVFQYRTGHTHTTIFYYFPLFSTIFTIYTIFTIFHHFHHFYILLFIPFLYITIYTIYTTISLLLFSLLTNYLYYKSLFPLTLRYSIFNYFLKVF